jgi:hypothetical protein
MYTTTTITPIFGVIDWKDSVLKSGNGYLARLSTDIAERVQTLQSSQRLLIRFLIQQ